MLFKPNDTATFKQFINVSFTFDVNNVFPGLKEAEEDYLVPILGEELYQILCEDVAGLGEIPEDDAALINRCRKMVAPLSIYLDALTRHLKIGDSGIKKTSSEGTENIFQWEFLQVKDELEGKVARATNDLWKYLYANAAAFDWVDPSPFKTVFKTADDFSNCYTLHLPYAVFPMLKPIIKQVETLFIHDAIGEEFLEELKVLAEPSADETKALALLRNAIAHFTIHKSVDTLPIKISRHGFTVLMNEATDKPYKGEASAPSNLMSLLRTERLKDGNLYMSKLKTMLNTKASAEVFVTYFNSSYYESPTTEKEDRNANRKGVVGF